MSSSWSPDGQRLAFTRNGRIFVQDGRGRTRLIADPGDYNNDPSWSPSGRRIAFEAGTNETAIYTTRPDGSDVRPLTNPGFHVFDEQPAWSPSGAVIVFDEGRPGTQPDLYLIDPDGGDRRLFVMHGSAPSWSPDGSLLVFVRYSAPYVGADLVIVGADGSGERVLTSTPDVEETNPAWSPDGDWIAFETRSPNTSSDIAVIRPDGTGFHAVRDSPLPETDPAWRPRAGNRPGKQRPCVIRPTRGGVLHGTSQGDLMLGNSGRDSISGGGGGDLIDGGSGPDRILGGPGKDILNGDFGADRLVGGAGDDLLYSGDGERDIVIGNSGRDHAYVDPKDRVRSVERVYRDP